MPITNIITTFLRSPIIIRLLTLVLIVVIFFGLIIHFIEPDQFPTIFDGIYWAIVTASTVGFGDFAPVSSAGRMVTIFLILSGAGFVTFYMASISSETINTFNSLKEGEGAFNDQDHMIIIGWNERVKHTIEYFKESKPEIKIVLMDQTLTENPYNIKDVHYIKGDGRYDHVLQKANIEEALMVLITANQHENELQADMQSILTLLAIKGLNPDVYCLVEILTPTQVENAKRAGANEIIESNSLLSHTMINSLLSHGMSGSLIQILNQLNDSQLTYMNVGETEENMTFKEGVHYLLETEGQILIGIKRGDESYINPSPQFAIQPNDQLLVIKN